MLRFISTVILLFTLSVSSEMKGQTNSKAPCSGEQYQQFDFWVGDWNVYDTTGKLIGTNHILKMQDDCVLQENWVSKSGPSRGTSYNYYNKTDDSWNQVWVDNSGFSLNLKGKLVNGKMVLKSDFITSKKGNYYNKITWSKNKDASVSQIWETFNEKNILIKELFRGIYKKK